MTARLPPPSTPLARHGSARPRPLYRVMLGGRTSLAIAGAAVLISLVLGLPLGHGCRASTGGRIDNVLMRLVDTLLSFPVLLLALTISAVPGPSVPNAIIAIGVAFTPFLARIVRGEALRVDADALYRGGPGGWRQRPTTHLAASSAERGAADHRSSDDQVSPSLSWRRLVFRFRPRRPAAPILLGLMIQASRDYLDVAPWTGACARRPSR